MVSLRQSSDLPQQVSVDHVGAGARILGVLCTNSRQRSQTNKLVFYHSDATVVSDVFAECNAVTEGNKERTRFKCSLNSGAWRSGLI